MFNDLKTTQKLIQLRREDMVRAAENERLVDAHTGHFYGPAMNQMGKLLVNMGTELQERYSTDTEKSDAPNKPINQPA